MNELWPGEIPAGSVSEAVSTGNQAWAGEGNMTPGEMAAEGMSPFDKIMVGAGREAIGAYEGIRQMLPEGFGGYSPEQEQRIQGEHQAFEQGLGDSNWATAGRILPYLAIPGAQGMAGGRVVAPLVDAGVAGLTEAMQYVDPGESRGERAMYGAVGGAAGRGVADFIGGRLSSLHGLRSSNKAARESGKNLADMARNEFRIPMSYGDQMGPRMAPGIRSTEISAEKMPFGTAKFRGDQGDAARRYAESLLTQHPSPPGGSGTTIQKSLKDVMAQQYEGVGRAYDDVQEIVGDATGTLSGAADEAARVVGAKRAMGQYGTKGAGDIPDVGEDVTKFLSRVDDETGDVLPLDRRG